MQVCLHSISNHGVTPNVSSYENWGVPRANRRAIGGQSVGFARNLPQFIAINGKKKAPCGASKSLIYSEIATFTN
jgi:hypothetical protein